MEEKSNLRFGKRIFILSLVTLTILKMVYSTILTFSHDEAYYWLWSRHLALGYYDHPPLVAWLIALFNRIGGISIFWTRLPAILCITGSIYLIYLIGREIGGEKAGLSAGFMALTVAPFVIGSVIISTDSPMILCWQFTAYFVLKAIHTQKPLFWYLSGVALGFGLLSKFLILPLILGIFLFLLFSKEDRFWLRRQEPYLAFGIALFIFTPFLIWNSQHNWTTFAFNLKRHDSPINFLMTLEYFVVQGALLGPVIYGIMLWSCYRLIRRLYKNDPSSIPLPKRHILYILFCGWLMPALFLLQSFKNEVGGHWPMAAYGVVFAGLAMELLNLYHQKKRSFKLLLRPWFLISVILWSALLVFATFNLEFLQTITNRKVNAGYGYRELAQRVEQIYRENGSDLVIATSTYGFSSFLSFYMPDYQISLLGPGEKYGRAYDTWDDWAHWTGRNLIFISEQPITDSSRTDKILQKSCTSYQRLPPLEIYRNGRLIWRYYLVLGYNLKPDPYTAARQKYRL